MLKKSTLLSVSIFFLLFIGLNTPSYACHRDFPHGSSDDPCVPDPDVARYSVVITGAVEGGSHDHWRENNGGQKRISLGQNSGNVGEIDLTFFTPFGDPFTTDRGANCFGFMSDDLVQMNGFGAIFRGRGGRADSTFWFPGCTDQGREPLLIGECKDDVSYVLKMFGDFEDGLPWPPADSNLLIMTDWTIERNESDANKNRSCIGGGEFDLSNPVQILVTRINEE